MGMSKTDWMVDWDRGICKSDIVKLFANKKNGAEVLAYLDNHLREESITIFKCVPAWESMYTKIKNLKIFFKNTELRAVSMIDKHPDYVVLHFSRKIQMNK